MRIPRGGDGCTPQAGQAGFAMVEVMVSAVLLIVLAMAMFPVFEQSASRASADRGRVTAASLAQAEQDRLRQLPIDKLRNLRHSDTEPVGGLDYVIRSRADITRDAGGVVACTADSSRAEYFRIQTTVTWPGMMNTDPVVLESIISPGVEGLDPNKGTLTVKLQNAAGGPQPGVSVTAGPFTDTTDSAGCAVFTGVPVGPTDVTFSAAGMVDRDGDAVGGGDDVAVVAGNATAIYSDQYDRPAAVPIRLRDESGANENDDLIAGSNVNGRQIAWPAVTLRSGAYVRRFPAAPSPTAPRATFAATSLFPFTAGYYVHAGTCDGMDPTAYKGDFFSAGQPGANSIFLTPPGTSLPESRAVMRTVPFYIRRGSSGAGPVRVWLSPASTPTPTPAGCAAANRTTMVYEHPGGSAASAGQPVDVSLPYGQWRACIDDPVADRKAISRFNIVVTPPGSATPSTNMAASGNVWDLRPGGATTTIATPSAGECTGYPT